MRKVYLTLLLAAGILLPAPLTRGQSAPGPDFSANLTQDSPFPIQEKVYYSHGVLRIDIPASHFRNEPRQVLLTSRRGYKTYKLLPSSRSYTIDQAPPDQLALFAPLPDPEHPCSALLSRMGANDAFTCEKTGSGRFLNRRVAIWTIRFPVMTTHQIPNPVYNSVDYLVDSLLGILLQEKSAFSRRQLTIVELKTQPSTFFEIPAGYRDASGSLLTQALSPEFDDRPQFDASLVSPEGDSTLNVGHGKIRIIFNGDKPILIADLASHRTILLNPDAETFRDESASFDDFLEFLRPLDPQNPCASLQLLKKEVTCAKIGSELLNGRFADKWQWSLNGAVGGTLWIDPGLQFPVKDVRSGRTFRELRYVREGPQPAELFEIPPSYRNAHPPEGKTAPFDKHPMAVRRN